MLSRHIARAAPLRSVVAVARPAATTTISRRSISQAEMQDPDMNGGYINPPAVKRQFRDPYGNWTDKQERRNWGETVHEDNDILGIFSPEEYTHVTPGKAVFQIACAIAGGLTLCGIVALNYPDKASYPKEYEGGLEAELGGPKAVRARQAGDSYP